MINSRKPESVSKAVIGLVLASLLGAGVNGCESDNTPLPPAPPQFALDIFLYQSPREQDINENFRFGGYLVKDGVDTLSGERIYFSIEPDSLGSISPPNYALTDKNAADGWQNIDVYFVGRKYGIGNFKGAYLDAQGNQMAYDTVWVEVKPPGNE